MSPIMYYTCVCACVLGEGQVKEVEPGWSVVVQTTDGKCERIRRQAWWQLPVFPLWRQSC